MPTPTLSNTCVWLFTAPKPNYPQHQQVVSRTPCQCQSCRWSSPAHRMAQINAYGRPSASSNSQCWLKIVQVFIEKNLLVSGPIQFKPMMFKGQLHDQVNKIRNQEPGGREREREHEQRFHFYVFTQEEWKHMSIQRFTASSCVYNDQQLEIAHAKCQAIGEWIINDGIFVCGILLNNKKEWTIDTHNMDKYQKYYLEWKKPDTRK